jgi:hypothetical protein
MAQTLNTWHNQCRIILSWCGEPHVMMWSLMTWSWLRPLTPLGCSTLLEHIVGSFRESWNVSPPLHIDKKWTMAAGSNESWWSTSGKRGFHPPPLVPKLFRPGLKGALVPVRAAGVRLPHRHRRPPARALPCRFDASLTAFSLGF